MGFYRKKPVVIEAVQLLDNKDSVNEAIIFIHGESEVSTEWLKGAYYEDINMQGYLGIQTLEGTMKASFGDWIIKGVSGEFYPCKPDIFHKTYETI